MTQGTESQFDLDSLLSDELPGAVRSRVADALNLALQGVYTLPKPGEEDPEGEEAAVPAEDGTAPATGGTAPEDGTVPADDTVPAEDAGLEDSERFASLIESAFGIRRVVNKLNSINLVEAVAALYKAAEQAPAEQAEELGEIIEQIKRMV